MAVAGAAAANDYVAGRVLDNDVEGGVTVADDAEVGLFAAIVDDAVECLTVCWSTSNTGLRAASGIGDGCRGKRQWSQ